MTFYFVLLRPVLFFHSTGRTKRVPAGTVIMTYDIRADEPDFWLTDGSDWHRSYLDDFEARQVSPLELLAMEAE